MRAWLGCDDVDACDANVLVSGGGVGAMTYFDLYGPLLFCGLVLGLFMLFAFALLRANSYFARKGQPMSVALWSCGKLALIQL